MANSYATFAAAGVRTEPYSIARITDRGGDVIYESTSDPERQFPKEEVGVLNAALRDVIAHGTGRGAGIGRDVAGKTGTTTDNRDAWFVGFTPQRATAVWVGHLDNTPLPGVTGGSAPAALFSRVMVAAHDGLEEASIYTASPDQLSLRMLTTSTSDSTTSSTDSTTSTSTSVSTSRPDEPATTTTSARRRTTTTEATTTTEQDTSGQTTTTESSG
jgi:membrane peptidoglycan carboxypeptidase